MPDSNSALRRELQRITGTDGGDVDQHPQLVAELSQSLPHAIRLAPANLAPAALRNRYNCFEFALGLAGAREVGVIARCFTSTYCNSEFVDYLSRRSVLVSNTGSGNGQLVFYRDSERFTHAGLVHGDSIISKWGRGHLWQHQLWEVPSSYGDSAERFRLKESLPVLGEFIRFAREREGSIVDDVLASG